MKTIDDATRIRETRSMNLLSHQRAFVENDHNIKMIRGPIGTGKTYALFAAWVEAFRQTPGYDPCKDGHEFTKMMQPNFLGVSVPNTLIISPDMRRSEMILNTFKDLNRQLGNIHDKMLAHTVITSIQRGHVSGFRIDIVLIDVTTIGQRFEAYRMCKWCPNFILIASDEADFLRDDQIVDCRVEENPHLL